MPAGEEDGEEEQPPDGVQEDVQADLRSWQLPVQEGREGKLRTVSLP